MTAAVLGGGLAGCLVALELAECGRRVVLFDAASEVLSRASRANEGKIHLGYVYGADTSLETARRLIDDALLFRPILTRWMQEGQFDRAITAPFQYIVPHDSQLSPRQVRHHFAQVEHYRAAAEVGTGLSYLGASFETNSQVLRTCPETGSVWLSSGERAVSPFVIADAIRECVMAHPRIELRLGTEVRRVQAVPRGWRIVTRAEATALYGPFTDVINATFAGRRSIDAASGFGASTTWITRLKYGVRLARASRHLPVGSMPANSTAMLGPYGDSVYYPEEDVLYCSWYPAGMIFASTKDGAERTPPTHDEAQRIMRDSWSGYAKMDPRFHTLAKTAPVEAASLSGDYIVASGETDITDTASRLHARQVPGAIALAPGYWSLDTGKYTSAPRCAEECVDAITEREQRCWVS